MKIGKKPVIILVLFLVVTVTVGAGVATGAGLMKINLNGKAVSPDAPPIIQKGRVMVPLRFISELFGADVAWDSKNQIVNLKYKEPLADDGPLGSLMLAEEVVINEDGTWELFEPGVCFYYTGYSHILAFYTADNLSEGPHAFRLAVKNSEGTIEKSILNTYNVGANGYFRMFEEVLTYFPEPGTYVVELGIDGRAVSKTAITVENPPAA